MKKEVAEKYKQEKEAKKLAMERWKEETAAQHRAEVNKPKLRRNRDVNTLAYEGPETSRLENKDPINKP
jgi:hypothetical protein